MISSGISTGASNLATCGRLGAVLALWRRRSGTAGAGGGGGGGGGATCGGETRKARIISLGGGSAWLMNKGTMTMAVMSSAWMTIDRVVVRLRLLATDSGRLDNREPNETDTGAAW
jgi:hypothetical protein